MKLPTPEIEIDRLMDELYQLASYSDSGEPSPCTTRVVFTPTDLDAREYLSTLYDEAGLEVRVDAVGNTFARWTGTSPDLPAIATGSHSDAIPHSGMYDGTVGVLGALEAIRALQRQEFQPKRSIELVMFTSEEPTRFGIGCTGSRLMSGSIAPDDLAKLVDSDGASFDDVRREAGFTGTLDSAVLSADHYAAFVELHIEQGPLLEKSVTDIGIVTAIAAPATLRFEVNGQGGHAGGVLMPDRHDALAAAAEMIVAVEQLARVHTSPDLVATVGMVEVYPGAVNSIPSRVHFSLDLRDIDGTNRDLVMRQITGEAEKIAERREVQVSSEILNADPPATCAGRVLDAAQEAADMLRLSSQKMISRAYHDSLFMARIAPTGMIFIPCRDGVSHRPDEYSSPKQIQAGVATLALTLARLTSE